MKREYFTLAPESIGVFLLVAVTWVIGSIELLDTFTHFSKQWYWFVLATIYTVTLNEIFCHRICSHKLFPVDVNRITFKVLAFLHAVDHGWGPLKAMCLSHLNHHMYSDQGNKDSLNPRIHWYNLCLLSPVTFIYQTPTAYPHLEKFVNKEHERFKEYVDDIWVFFVEEYRFVLTILFWTVLYFIAPVVLFKVVLMGRFLMSIFMAMAAIGGHCKIPGSYRNFNTKDTSQNNLVFHYFALGMLSTMLHNNHHGRPRAFDHANKWYEVDVGYYIIKLLKPLLEKR